MNSSKVQVSSALQVTEDEIQRLQEVAKHLREALKVIGKIDNESLSSALSPQVSISSQESVSLLIDKYLQSLKNGESFLVGDAISAACAGGHECTDELRGRVSSVLSRRVKAGMINRVGRRGSFIKPLTTTGEMKTAPVEIERHPTPESVSNVATAVEGVSDRPVASLMHRTKPVRFDDEKF